MVEKKGMEDCKREQAERELLAALERGEISALEKGWISLEDVVALLGLDIKK